MGEWVNGWEGWEVEGGGGVGNGSRLPVLFVNARTDEDEAEVLPGWHTVVQACLLVSPPDWIRERTARNVDGGAEGRPVGQSVCLLVLALLLMKFGYQGGTADCRRTGREMSERRQLSEHEAGRWESRRRRRWILVVP